MAPHILERRHLIDNHLLDTTGCNCEVKTKPVESFPLDKNLKRKKGKKTNDFEENRKERMSDSCFKFCTISVALYLFKPKNEVESKRKEKTFRIFP